VSLSNQKSQRKISANTTALQTKNSQGKGGSISNVWGKKEWLDKRREGKWQELHQKAEFTEWKNRKGISEKVRVETTQKQLSKDRLA